MMMNSTKFNEVVAPLGRRAGLVLRRSLPAAPPMAALPSQLGHCLRDTLCPALRAATIAGGCRGSCAGTTNGPVACSGSAVGPRQAETALRAAWTTAQIMGAATTELSFMLLPACCFTLSLLASVFFSWCRGIHRTVHPVDFMPRAVCVQQPSPALCRRTKLPCSARRPQPSPALRWHA